MREALAPPAAPPLTGGLADSLFETAARTPALPLLARRPDPAAARWEEVTAAEVRDEVVGLARGLIASGIQPGERVGDHGADPLRVDGARLRAVVGGRRGGADLPGLRPGPGRVDPADAGCVAVVVEDEQGVMTVGSVCATLPSLRHVWQLDAGALAELTARGEPVPAPTVDSLRRIVLPDATAVVAYTSGTSGRALGCALSHRGLAGPCDVLLAGWGHTAAPPGEQGSVLAFLPFSHVYGLMIQSLCVRGGLLMGHEPEMDAATLASALRSFRPTCCYAVPSVLEKIYKNFLRARPSRPAGARCSNGRRRPPGSTRRPWSAAGWAPARDPASTCGSSTPCTSGRSTAGCATPWAAGCAARPAAAPRSAGSCPCSSRASASMCTTGTG
ncbi:hypothetical protein SFUMM280S_00301 [Streptomyces fumanus]